MFLPRMRIREVIQSLVKGTEIETTEKMLGRGLVEETIVAIAVGEDRVMAMNPAMLLLHHLCSCNVLRTSL
jgi:hypothetical protein